MNTPIVDYVSNYIKSDNTRAHMPGHKGAAFLGFENWDITEIKGADSLYRADGIIAESEANATRLFGSAGTFFSTEGSSQCIKAMLYLTLTNRRISKSATNSLFKVGLPSRKPYIIAGRNAHTSFIHGVALLDMDVEWIYSEDDNLCSCNITAKLVKEMLDKNDSLPVAVYITSPDYLGNCLNIKEIAKVCHDYDVMLLVDNAHGSYLNFLNDNSRFIHPIKAGADMCCDSAHKTLPVLTGGAYLHIAADNDLASQAKYALGIFGSTSPSYLILESLDKCNEYINSNLKNDLRMTVERIDKLKASIKQIGLEVLDTDPLKVTIQMNPGISGTKASDILRQSGVECEYSDSEYVVMMLSPMNSDNDFDKILTGCNSIMQEYMSLDIDALIDNEQDDDVYFSAPKKVSCIRDAVISRHETVNVTEALGRVCASPTVACPPAIAVAVPGELIDENLIRLFQKYDIETVEVI